MHIFSTKIMGACVNLVVQICVLWIRQSTRQMPVRKQTFSQPGVKEQPLTT
jgi:hypothetical protein